VKFTSWIERVGRSLKRGSSRKAMRPDCAVQASERLEERSLLSASTLFIAGELNVSLGPKDGVAIRDNPAVPGNVLVVINGTPVSNLSTVTASSVTKIIVNGGDDANLIDLSGVTGSIFNNPALRLVVNAGNGADTLLGSSDLADSLNGGDGDDSIVGNGGNDTLLGSDGNDSITGGIGNDSIDAGDGRDTVNGNQGDDTILAGNGQDSVDGSTGNDSISGDDGADSLNGGDDNDTLNGMAGTDSIDGQVGDDSILGGSGDDTLLGNVGNDTIDGQAGLDSILGGDGTDSLTGGDGNDSMVGEAGNDTLNGSAGNDTMDGGDGNDSLIGGAGNDSLTGGTGDDSVRGQAGQDTLLGGGGIDLLDGGAGNDLIISRGPEVSISDAITTAEGDFGTSLVTFTVTLSQVSLQTVVVNYTTQDGTAVAGSDYQAAQGVLTFLPGEFQKTISVAVIGDTIGEGSETFSVLLTPGQNAVIQDNSGSATIADDDVQFQINDVSANEGATGQTPFVFTVSLSRPSAGTVSVQYVTANNDAVGGLDYVTTSGTLTFAPGTTTQTITVNVFGDNVGENTEQFFVNLSNPVGGAITDSQGIGSIVDDDGGPLTFPSLEGLIGTFGELENEPQVPPGASAFTFTDNNRWNATATQGAGLVQGQATILTWGIVPDGTPVDDGTPSDLIARLDAIYNETATGPNITTRTWFNLFVSVFDNYSSFSGLSYVYEPNDDRGAFPDSTGVVGVRPDIRIGGRDIDGDGGVLAFNYFPNFSDMVIDTNDAVYQNTANNSLILRNILAHEHGHGLGFPHVMPVNQTKLMEPFLATNFDGPQEDDILATNRGYGDRNEKGAGNDTSAVATALGTVTPTAPIIVNQVSIDDDSDTDVYSFTIGQNVTANILVTPTGTTYLSGTQGGPTPTTFNAMAQSDLAVQILAPDGTTVLNTTDTTGLGQGETVSNLLLGSGTYFVRVTGAQNMVQMYDLGITVTASSVGPTPTVSDEGDILIGGDGDDVVFGNTGNDTISGDAGNDIFFGGDGNDSISGGLGNDFLDGQAGDDTLRGGGGRDTVIGGEGNDTYEWNATSDGDDNVSSTSGDDRMSVTTGGASDIVAVGKVGSKMKVTSGANELIINPTIRLVTIDTGTGDDTVTIGNISGITATVLTINTGAGDDTIDGSGGVLGNVRLGLNGGDGNDSITGTTNDDTIDGGAGIDTLLGGAGNDTMFGGTEADIINGQAGDDSILGGDGNDNVAGGTGNDVIRAGLGQDIVNGNEGADTLVGDDGRDTISGGAGNDSIDGGLGKDSLSGGDDNDTLDGGFNDDTINGDAGADVISGNHGNDLIDAGAGADTVNGGDGNDTINGGDDKDLLGGGDGDDVINGGMANDIVIGGDGKDSLLGGSGNDILFGNDGDDLLNGQGGIDTMAGGQGNDSLIGASSEIIENFTISNDLLKKLDLL